MVLYARDAGDAGTEGCAASGMTAAALSTFGRYCFVQAIPADFVAFTLFGDIQTAAAD